MNIQEAAFGGAKLATEKKVAISGGVLALALGSGLAATPAEATLIATSLNVNVAPGNSYTFGPHSDEFTITNLGFSGPVLGVGLDGNTTSLSTNYVAVKAPASTGLREFSPGDVVDSTVDWNTSGSEPIFSKPANNIIYGLQSVDLADAATFGYVQVDVLASADIHLDGFAFETDPGVGAVVAALPDTKVPEPGTLGLFATGAVALLSTRRRKAKRA
jgi:hypothetical protein